MLKLCLCRYLTEWHETTQFYGVLSGSEVFHLSAPLFRFKSCACWVVLRGNMPTAFLVVVFFVEFKTVIHDRRWGRNLIVSYKVCIEDDSFIALLFLTVLILMIVPSVKPQWATVNLCFVLRFFDYNFTCISHRTCVLLFPPILSSLI